MHSEQNTNDKTSRQKKTKLNRQPMPWGKVLVVDDMQSNLDVAKLLLTPYQLKVDSAGSGFEAIELIKSRRVYDLIFMDHMMPKMDGLEALKILRSLGCNEPIIAISASDETGQGEMFLEKGFDGFISRPINISQLDDFLNMYIRDKTNNKKAEFPPNLEPGFIKGGENSGIKITGLDTETGLALYGGDEAAYFSVLRSYVPNAEKVIEKLRHVSEESLGDYAIKVHGLKGISAGIGAEELRELAYKLEIKAKAGDLEGVLFLNEGLIKEAENIVQALKSWINGEDKKNPKPLLPCPDLNTLNRLREGCASYDMNEIDEAMDLLESANYQKDAALVSWLRERIDDLEFDLAVSRLSEILE